MGQFVAESNIRAAHILQMATGVKPGAWRRAERVAHFLAKQSNIHFIFSEHYTLILYTIC